MKITLERLVGSFDALMELSQLKLPAASSMRVALVLKAATPVLEQFQVEYNKLLQEVGTPDATNPKNFTINDKEKFARESQELYAQEVELPGDPITNLGNAEVKPATLMALDWLIQL